MPGAGNVFAGFALVENVPSSNVQWWSRIGPSGSLAFAVKWTVSGTIPFVRSATGAQTGGRPEMVLRRNQGLAVGSVLKKANNSEPTFATPLVEGWVKSLSRSVGHTDVKPSERPFKPSVHRYGPHESHGATTGPLAGS